MPTTYSELPAAVSHALHELTQSISDLLGGRQRANLAAIERCLVGSLATVGAAVMGEALAQLDPRGEDVSIGGKRYWQAVRSAHEYMSAFGPVTVDRGVYREVRNGPTLCPMELRAGIVEGFWTPHAAKLAALCIADMTPYRAEAFFSELRMMSPSRSSLDRLPKAVNKHWEASRESYEARLIAVETVPADAVAAAVSLDGVMVPMRDGGKAAKKADMRQQGRPDKGPAGYREVGCGTLSFYDIKGNRLLTRRMARMPEANKKTLKEQLGRELEHVRAQRPDLVIVGVADGAPNNWEYLATLGCTHQVVDFYHAAEHLKRALDVCMGASSVATQAAYDHLRTELRDSPNGVDTVIRALRKLRPRGRGDARDYRTGLRYFERHRHRMNYARLQAHQLPIGSGVIEGTCKSLASDRLKRAGMRWDNRGGQAVLNLRAWVQSDRFDTAWELLQASYSAKVIEYRAVA